MDPDSSTDDFWSQLVSLTDINAPIIPINKDKFLIGRNPEGCDLSHNGNKLVSGKHCYIERDAGGKVWLYDTSTNGTLLNLKIKITKGECRQLNHGDEIYIVYKKDEPESNIGYMFQDKTILDQAEDSDSEDEPTQDYTQEADQTMADALINDIPSPSSCKKRKAEDDDESEKGDETKSQKLEEKPEKESLPAAVTPSKEEEKKEKPPEPDDSAIMESLVCIICQELLHDCISLQPCMHSFCAGCYSEWMEKSDECPSCRTKVDRINKNHLVNNLVEAFLKNKPVFRRPEEDLKELDAKNKITRDMLYPGKTRNSFGTGSDYSDEEENEEDEEEEEEEEANVDVAMPVVHNNIANTGVLFGIGTPLFGIARPPNIVCRQCPGFHNTPAARDATTGIQHMFSAIPRYIRTIFRGTPTPPNDNNQPGNNHQATPGPSTSGDGDTQNNPDPDAKVLPANPPDYTCHANQNHVLCLCCMQPMPDRRGEFRILGDMPPQQCQVCFRAFCHAYWGCLKLDCMGCIGKFKDMNFGKKCLAGIILDNAYESEVFKNYLEREGISVKQVLATCVEKINSGQYTFQNQMRFHHGVNTPVCYACGLQTFKELCYQYRKDIPKEGLSVEAMSRPNCYWGKNCRTQRNKPEHAQRYNHICEQTRTL